MDNLLNEIALQLPIIVPVLATLLGGALGSAISLFIEGRNRAHQKKMSEKRMEHELRIGRDLAHYNFVVKLYTYNAEVLRSMAYDVEGTVRDVDQNVLNMTQGTLSEIQTNLIATGESELIKIAEKIDLQIHNETAQDRVASYIILYSQAIFAQKNFAQLIGDKGKLITKLNDEK